MFKGTGILKKILKVILLLLVIFAILSSIWLYFLLKDLPDYQKLESYSLPSTSRFYASEGTLLAEFAREHRIFIPINNVPQALINAFLAAEDKNFYTNPGVDFSSILRALVTNLLYFREHKLVGGSTITQQLVKNLVLTNEKTIQRKIKEAVISFRINKILSKDQIMELYLNKIYFGNGTYGIGAASVKYFNKNIDQLKLEEIALLAALPQAPSKLNPYKNFAKVVERRDWVLQRMMEEGFISEEEGVKAQLNPLILSTKTNENIFPYDYFTEEVRREIIKRYSESYLYEDGLYVETTLIPRYQATANKILKENLTRYTNTFFYNKPPLYLVKNLNNWQDELKQIAHNLYFYASNLGVILAIKGENVLIGLKEGQKITVSNKIFNLQLGEIVLIFADETEKGYVLQQFPKVNGGIVILEPSTGKVLALAGGFDFHLNQFNTVTQAVRQPGSLFKPFIYLTALINNFTPETIVEDEPLEVEQGKNTPPWIPRNFENNFIGPISVRNGLTLSRNIVTIQIANAIGIHKVMELAKSFNIYDTKKTNPAIALGSEGVTLLKITNAYAIIANGGKFVLPSLIEKIQDNKGKTIFKLDNSKCTECNYSDTLKTDNFLNPIVTLNQPRIIDENYAYQLTYLLKGAVENGTAKKLKLLNINMAAKTGTSNDSKDAWVVGYTPEIVVGVYIGCDQPVSLGNSATGGKIAVPILADFMREFCKTNNCSLPFKTPKTISYRKIKNSKENTFFEAFIND